MQQQSTLEKFLLSLIIIGAINWLFVGLFQYDLVASIFGGASSFLSRTIYSIVGLCGLFAISLLFKDNSTALNRSQI